MQVSYALLSITVDGERLERVSPLSRLSCTCNELIKPLIKQQTSSKCVADFNYAHRYLREKQTFAYQA